MFVPRRRHRETYFGFYFNLIKKYAITMQCRIASLLNCLKLFQATAVYCRMKKKVEELQECYFIKYYDCQSRESRGVQFNKTRNLPYYTVIMQFLLFYALFNIAIIINNYLIVASSRHKLIEIIKPKFISKILLEHSLLVILKTINFKTCKKFAIPRFGLSLN